MQYLIFLVGILLFLTPRISTTQTTDAELSQLTDLETKLQTYALDPQVTIVAQYFIQPYIEINSLPVFDEYRNATLIVNALLVSLNHKDNYLDPSPTLRPSDRLLQLATYALDDIGYASHQLETSSLTNFDESEKTYLCAINRIENAIHTNNATLVTKTIQSYIRNRSKNR